MKWPALALQVEPKFAVTCECPRGRAALENDLPRAGLVVRYAANQKGERVSSQPESDNLPEAKPPLVTFHRFIPQARLPQRADRSAIGTMPTRAFRYCEAIVSASAF